MRNLVGGIRQRFWLLVMDMIVLSPSGFGSRPYSWALERASNATDWGEGADCGKGEPF
jgi:hypothetical protein